MEIGAKRVVHHGGEKAYFVYCFPESGPFIEGERGWPSVDLGCTKETLILSRDPNQSTEEHVQKETSLSSTPIVLPNAHHKSNPGRNQRPECGKCVWRSAQRKVQGTRGAAVGVAVQVPIISNLHRFNHSPGGVITLVSEPPSWPARYLPPITEECPFTQGHLHYP